VILKLMLDAETAAALQYSAECNQRDATAQAIALIRQALGLTTPASAPAAPA
jgi:hypothetical protein